MPRIFSGVQDILTEYDDSEPDPDPVDVWNPMTQALPSAQVKYAKYAIYVAGEDNATVTPGLQFSPDGVEWDAAVQTYSNVQPVSDGVWNFDDTNWNFADIATGTTQKAFVRFGIWANTSSDTGVRPFQANLMVEYKPVIANTIVTPWATVYADSTDPRNFMLTQALPVTEDFGEVRYSWEIASEVGDDVTLQATWGEANEPVVSGNWTWTATGSTFDDSSCTVDGEKWIHGEDFTSITPTERYVAFGVQAKLAAPGLGMIRVRARIEYRRTTS